ncbi:hypothetical protein ABFT80_16980 [Mesorhizobium sp. SB112]
MRYVVAVCLITGLIVWDAARNNGRYLDMVIRALQSLMRSVGI